MAWNLVVATQVRNCLESGSNIEISDLVMVNTTSDAAHGFKISDHSGNEIQATRFTKCSDEQRNNCSNIHFKITFIKMSYNAVPLQNLYSFLRLTPGASRTDEKPALKCQVQVTR